MTSLTPSTRTTTLYDRQTDDGLISITQTGTFRSLYFGNNTKQSEVDMLAPHQLTLRYTQAMMSALLLNPTPKQVLIIGLGAGSMVNFLWHHFPEIYIDAVEQRADVAKLAVGYFALPIDPRISIIVADGLKHLRTTDKHYDLILVDAFTHEGVAPGVTTNSFFATCKKALNPNGIMCANLWDHTAQKYTQTLREIDTVFQQQLLILNVEDRGNVVVLATASKLPKRLKMLRALAKTLSNKLNLDFSKYLKHLKSPGYAFKFSKWANLS